MIQHRFINTFGPLRPNGCKVIVLLTSFTCNIKLSNFYCIEILSESSLSYVKLKKCNCILSSYHIIVLYYILQLSRIILEISVLHRFLDTVIDGSNLAASVCCVHEQGT